jgi:hypothetical protein
MADDTTPDPSTDESTPKSDATDLGDAGKKALKAERDARAAEKKRADALESRLREIEDKDKSEVERLTARVAELEKDLGAATVTGARLKVALDKGLTVTQAKRLVGDTEDDLSADADELLADLGAKPGDERKAPPGGRPREELKPGNGDPDTPVEETDVKKIGERMFAR